MKATKVMPHRLAMITSFDLLIKGDFKASRKKLKEAIKLTNKYYETN